MFWWLLLGASVFVTNCLCSTCFRNRDCTNPDEICCLINVTCSSNFKKCYRGFCFQNWYCPFFAARKRCVNLKCKAVYRMTSTSGSNTCSWDEDCRARRARCCHGKCKDFSLCSIATTTTTISRSEPSCISWKDCAQGHKCEGGTCKDNSDVTLTKAGFLSAAVLTGSVFFLILCYCFVRESRKRRQRHAERQRPRRISRNRRSRQSRRRSTLPRLAVENRAFNTDREGGFTIPPPEYPRAESTSVDQHCGSSLGEQSSSPPPYCTLSFDLPPPYEEVIRTEEVNRGGLTEVA